jgi:beta-xylosidase
MFAAIKFWNEPNNLSHWDFEMDPEWAQYAQMVRHASATLRDLAPALPQILGGISPIDPDFVRLLASHGVIDGLDGVAVHGFPLDWNHWKIDEWPEKVAQIESVARKPVWVTEVGASTFGADEVQVFGLERTMQLLRPLADRVYWYSLFDLPQAWGATTRHKESEGSAYYRHFHMGLIRADGTPKLALERFDPAFGICQWFHFNDERLMPAVQWLRRMNVRRLRTGISWADWHRPGALHWFDRQMEALREFELMVTLCFTPPSRGRRYCHTSPPADPLEFADFAYEVVSRYALPEWKQRARAPASIAGR